jgi:hypothetical protein
MCLSMPFKYLCHGGLSGFFDFLICVVERQAELGGQSLADGCLACPHEADQNNTFIESPG